MLSLYDNGRLKEPMKGGEVTDQASFDADVRSKLDAAKRVVVLSHSVSSPSYKKMMSEWTSANPNVGFIQYDSVDHSGKLDAWEQMTGVRAMPSVDMASARVIVAVGLRLLVLPERTECVQGAMLIAASLERTCRVIISLNRI